MKRGTQPAARWHFLLIYLKHNVMSTITLTKSTVAKYAELYTPPIISISKSAISFTAPAVSKLAMEKGTPFFLEVIDRKLWYRDGKSEYGFLSASTQLRGISLKAHASGILGALLHEKVISELTTTKFQIGEFKEGRWELLPFQAPIKKVKNNRLKDNY